MTDATSSPRRANLLAALLFGSGTLHFAVPRFFDSIVPRILPGSARSYTYVSGVAELGIAGMLVLPSTRRFGGLLAALLFIAVFPANIQFTVDSLRNPKTPLPVRIVSVARLPMQVPLITQALRVRRGNR